MRWHTVWFILTENGLGLFATSKYSFRPFPIKSYLNIRKYKKSEHNKTELNRI